jgi:hypothetical protein
MPTSGTAATAAAAAIVWRDGRRLRVGCAQALRGSVWTWARPVVVRSHHVSAGRGSRQKLSGSQSAHTARFTHFSFTYIIISLQ